MDKFVIRRGSVEATHTASQFPSSSLSVPPSFCAKEMKRPDQLSTIDQAQHQSCANTDNIIDLNREKPSQPLLQSYPKSKFGTRERAFSSEWYKTRKWLEYSVSKDACFCFPCRVFSTGQNDKDIVFTVAGFRNWKHALENGKGFAKHVSSQTHTYAALALAESAKRMQKGDTISFLLDTKVIENNRYYLKSIGEVIQFLVVNELPLRGDTEDVLDFSGGLFLKLFQYTLKKDKKLADIAQSVPKNARYTSKDIQNEVIDTLKSMVLSKIEQRYDNCDSKSFCIKSDGTRDKCNIENLSLIVRFVSKAKPEEHLIGLLQLEKLDAEHIAEQILSHLTKCNFRPEHIIAQCYDGASVMSGCNGGVQAVIQRRLNRCIPYIHCYNHQLHLVVIHAIQSEPSAKRFFDLCNLLHTFFHRHYVSQRYNGPALKRLLEIRWTSHYEVTKCVVENIDNISDLLSEIYNDDSASSELRAESRGILSHIRRENVYIVGTFLLNLLLILKPANSAFQTAQTNLSVAVEIVQSTLEALKSMRADPMFYIKYCSPSTAENISGDVTHLDNGPKRRRTLNCRFADSVVCTTVGQSENDNDSSITEQQMLRKPLLHILDRAIAEMETRFSQKNTMLIEAIAALVPSSQHFLDVSVCSPLLDLKQISKSTLEAELVVAKPLLQKKITAGSNIATICEVVNNYADAFPALHEIYVSALVIGISTASCENSFSTMSRVVTAFRRSMLHDRKENLTILAHEKELTENLCMDDFVREFSKIKRKLPL